MKLSKSEMYALARKIRGKAVEQASKEMKSNRDSTEVREIVKRDFELMDQLSPQMKEYIEFKHIQEDSVREMVATAKFGPEKEVLNIDKIVDQIILASRDVNDMEELKNKINPFDDEQRDDRP